jgi:subtilisin family serine protease
MRSRRTGRTGPRIRPLEIEQLEERNLLDAGGTTGGLTPLAWVAVTPNDPSFASQYALTKISATSAWNVSTGSMKTVVGTVDTGIDYNHSDLYLNIWVNQAEIPDFWYTKSSASSTTFDRKVYKSQVKDVDGDGLLTFRDFNASQNAGLIWDNNGDGRIDAGDLLRPMSQGGWNSGSTRDGDTAHPDDFFGWNFVTNTNDPYDDNGHGTHVAGIIGATGNNGVGVAGVNWNVQIMALKFLGADGTGSVAGAVSALDYSIAHGAFVTNHSWSMGNSYWQPLYDAMSRARAAGQIIVAAAGNNSGNNDTTPAYPASFNLSNVIDVAATTSSDTLASFSNYGPNTVAIAAPGNGILSTYTGNRYMTMSGTSMATPFVTGAAALLHSLHPTWSASQVISQVLSSADSLTSLTGKDVGGRRLDLAKAVGASTADSVGPRVVSMTANGTGLQPATSVRVTFSEAIDPNTFTTADIVSFTRPGGTVTVTGIRAVAGSGNTQFDLTFASQTTPGTYQLVLGPDIRDAQGNLMDQNRNGVNGEATADRFTGTFTINPVLSCVTGGINLADNATTVVPISIGDNMVVTNLNIRLTITHPHVSDLYIHLRGPDGTDVVLFNRRGGSGANLQATLFDDTATLSISTGSAPFAGTFRPETPLSALIGRSAQGTWQLVIEDRAVGNRGRLNLVTLNVEMTARTSSASVVEQTSEAAPAVQAQSGGAEFAAVGRFLQDDAKEEPAVASMPRSDSLPTSAVQDVMPYQPSQQREPAPLPASESQDAAQTSDLGVDDLLAYFQRLAR